MPDETPNPTAAAAKPAPRLMNRAQAIQSIQDEVDRTSLTAVATHYDISISQLSDILRGTANLSKRARRLLRFKLHEFYEKVARAG